MSAVNLDYFRGFSGRQRFFQNGWITQKNIKFAKDKLTQRDVVSGNQLFQKMGLRIMLWTIRIERVKEQVGVN